MTGTFEATPVYCPECDEDYRIAWSKEQKQMYVVCGCGEAEDAAEFLDRFREEYDEPADDGLRGYQ